MSIMIVACGESKKERIEKDTAKILIRYNTAIAKYKKNVNDVYEGARFLGFSNTDILMVRGVDWKQKGWDTLRVYYKIDSLERVFNNLYGEDEYNLLKLKIDDNWNNKMK